MKQTLLEIPNLCSKSGISLEYLTVLGPLYNFLERIENDEPPRIIFLAKKALAHRKIPGYLEYFSPDKYRAPSNEQNQIAIQRLYNLIRELNDKRENLDLNKNSKIEYKELARLGKEIKEIIFGEQ